MSSQIHTIPSNQAFIGNKVYILTSVAFVLSFIVGLNLGRERRDDILKPQDLSTKSPRSVSGWQVIHCPVPRASKTSSKITG